MNVGRSVRARASCCETRFVDLWAPWCGPFPRVSPVLEKLAGELAGRLKLIKVHVNESPNLSRRFDAQAIPTRVLLKDGKVIARQVGAAPAAVLRSWLTEKLPSKTSCDHSVSAMAVHIYS